jgi:hypothetical protein
MVKSSFRILLFSVICKNTFFANVSLHCYNFAIIAEQNTYQLEPSLLDFQSKAYEKRALNAQFLIGADFLNSKRKCWFRF